MSTDHHTPIATGAAANAATFNAPLGQLDAAIGSGGLSADGSITGATAQAQKFTSGIKIGSDQLTIFEYDSTSLEITDCELRIRSAGGTTALFGVNNTDSTARAFASDRPTDLSNLFQIMVNGQMRWGGGLVGGTDCTLYRADTGSMRWDNAIGIGINAISTFTVHVGTNQNLDVMTSGGYTTIRAAVDNASSHTTLQFYATEYKFQQGGATFAAGASFGDSVSIGVAPNAAIGLYVSGTYEAATAVARGVLIGTTSKATENNDYLIALQIDSAYDADGKTGTKPFAIYSGDDVPSYFEGSCGIGAATPTAKLHIDQSSTTAAVPVLLLDQADVSEPFIKLVGASTTDNSQSLVDAADLEDAGAIVGWFKVYVEDVQGTNPITDGAYWVPFYATPTHSA